jgi:hypothetical protein
MFWSRQYREEQGQIKGRRTYHGFAATFSEDSEEFLFVAKAVFGPRKVWGSRRYL